MIRESTEFHNYDFQCGNLTFWLNIVMTNYIKLCLETSVCYNSMFQDNLLRRVKPLEHRMSYHIKCLNKVKRENFYYFMYLQFHVTTFFTQEWEPNTNIFKPEDSI
jgi:hypothetical protein